MRQLHSWVPAAVALIAFASSSAPAAEIDPSYAVRGAGVSLEDLMLDSSNGAVAFFLNAGCLLLYGALGILAHLKGTRRAKRVSAQAYWAAR